MKEKHGFCKKNGNGKWVATYEYKVWLRIRQRCTNPNRDHYDRYGGRGIKVCERWNSFINFLKDMGPRPLGMSIECRNNDGNYEPGNCYWATKEEQQNNKSNNHKITVKGETHSISEWAFILNKNKYTISTRLQRGWTEEEALFS
jgi:hypothetical protein